MALVRPRLNDFHGLAFTQEEADFAIPFLDDDIPLYVDPFLLWKSPSMQDQSLHTALVSSFNHFGFLAKNGKEKEAIEALIRISECQEAGLGSARNKHGKRIGEGTAKDILTLFSSIPQVKQGGFEHLEEIQLFVDQIGKDRVSDLTCSLTKSFLIDFTIDQCTRHGIPTKEVTLDGVFDYTAKAFKSEKLPLPVNPVAGKAVYNWQIATAAAPTVILQKVQTTPANVLFSGLTLGVLHVVTANVMGTAGPSDWCEPASIIAV